MSLEHGGRADKEGNTYENRFLARLFLQLINEKFKYIQVEPVGENSDYAEFIAVDQDGTQRYYQCKASNNSQPLWRICDLKKYDVFQRARKIITENSKNEYYFISPLQYGGLDELCKRARTNSSPEEFVQFQLTSESFKRLFNKCIKEFGLDNNIEDVEKTISLLAHCYFELYASGTEAEQDLELYIGTIFTGKTSTVRVLLEQYANDRGIYGKKITAKDVVDYLKEKDFHLRDYYGARTVLSRINDLNSIYWEPYHVINNTFIHRTATDKIIECIEEGHSVILHGKAGSGKSGCLEETIRHLNQTKTLYLAVKLDKHVPHGSADDYGKELGLPESPVHCLSILSAKKPCVLILDQLDALRWTNNHSSNALDVCKELIHQAKAINKYSEGNISIIIASRTFDLDNDRGLKDLFDSSEPHGNMEWAKVNVSDFSKEDVVEAIGDSYYRFSSRLQKLLLTPSSLYVWSKLDEDVRDNTISSVSELMERWWRQIQEKCISAGVQIESVNRCKDKIVNLMESRGVFSLPKILFTNQTNEIDFLVSSGMLVKNESTKSVSFAHQSFLDFFITADLLEKIYLDEELKSLIGDKNQQTPFIRYRVLTVLQTLIDSDPVLFVKQSVSLLAASNVRFYFKCAVFEIVGQCANPIDEICKLVDEYIQRPEWSDYITQVVLYGNPVFVRRLFFGSCDTFPSDEKLSLLKSISSEEPDFVTDILRQFAFISDEQDRKIFNTLCHDINDDSDAMFELRMQLIKKHTSLLYNPWRFNRLIEELSSRAIDLFEIIIDSWPNQRFSHIIYTSSSNHSNYIHQYAWQIMKRLFPKICEATSDYQPHWPDDRWYREYTDWEQNKYEEYAVRQITKMVKNAFALLAQSSPDELITFIKSVRYPLSAVGHECIMHAIIKLPEDYADEAVGWLLEDISEKIFVFTANRENYLSDFSQIIKKFTPVCNDDLFRNLEKYIVGWKEPNEKMENVYRYRLKAKKDAKEPIYTAYWGHFQKTLLPSMDQSRLSTYARQLLGVVNRNTCIYLPYFHCGIISGPAQTVVSPVDKYLERLSDKTWLQIIATPVEKMNGKFRGDDNGECYVEADHMLFASSIRTQANRQPLRFAKLALQFPENCYEGYVSNVLHALAENCSSKELDVEVVSKVVQRYDYKKGSNIAMAISWLVEKHADVMWPNKVIDIIDDIALNHCNPERNEYKLTSESDPENVTAHWLFHSSLNCARGSALYAISALLRSHYELADRFKETLQTASKDLNYAVRFAVVPCVLPCYDIDKEFAVNILNGLANDDLRIINAHGYWEILSREYRNRADYYRQILIEACMSKISDVAEHAAELLCAVGIYFDDQKAVCFIKSHQLTATQEERICAQAAFSFKSDEFNEKSKEVLLYLIDCSSGELTGLSRLFSDQVIEINRDEDFLIHLMESRKNTFLYHAFLEYLYNSDTNICEFAHIIETIGNSLSQMSSETVAGYIVSDLIKCVIRLFDKGKEDLSIRESCLDIWDKLFMSNLRDIKPLSDMIDEF